jgi:hypothetical protein
MKNVLILFSLLCSSLLVTAAPGLPVLADEVAGTWSYSVDTPNGTYKGQFVFTQTDEGYSGKMLSQGMETELKNLQVDGKNVSFSLSAEGYSVKAKITLDGDVLDGKIEVDYEFFPIKGKRVE